MFQKMPQFMKQHIRGKWTHEAICVAVRDVEMYKTSERQAITENGVSRQTFRRYSTKLHNRHSPRVNKSPPGRLTVLRADQQEELIMDVENRMCGLNLVDVRQLVFQYYELNNHNNPFNKLTKMVWMRAFLDRNRDIALRTPEATSIQCAIGFNRVNVCGFYDRL